MSSSPSQAFSRLGSRAIWDLRLQLRNGFYYAAAAVVVMLCALLVWLPEESLPWVLPAVLFGNIATNGFYFMAGLVLLEKGEGSLEAQVVTPLRGSEYLLAKVSTLGLLSAAESFLIVALSFGGDVRWGALGLGVISMSAILACFGFLTVARYDSVNEFLFPSVVVVGLLALPMLSFFGLLGAAWDVVMYAHPIHAPLRLVGVAFGPGSAAGGASDSVLTGVATAVSVAWTGAAFVLCRRSFRRFVVASVGAR